jgi:cytochrome c-type biogenesis protein CcmH/NrfG
MNLGSIYLQQGDYDRALSSYEESLKLDPEGLTYGMIMFWTCTSTDWTKP